MPANKLVLGDVLLIHITDDTLAAEYAEMARQAGVRQAVDENFTAADQMAAVTSEQMNLPGILLPIQTAIAFWKSREAIQPWVDSEKILAAGIASIVPVDHPPTGPQGEPILDLNGGRRGYRPYLNGVDDSGGLGAWVITSGPLTVPGATHGLFGQEVISHPSPPPTFFTGTASTTQASATAPITPITFVEKP